MFEKKNQTCFFWFSVFGSYFSKKLKVLKIKNGHERDRNFQFFVVSFCVSMTKSKLIL